MTDWGKIHIGTSGWHYKHWRGPFYPRDLSPREFLTYYSQYFDTVEINNTFYQLPDKTTFRDWHKTAPSNFTFAVKASRYITHMKKLKQPEEALGNFLEHTMLLSDKLGPVLFQLPPRWKANPGRLGEFLALLPKDIKCAFEFRDTSWFQDDIYQILKEKGVAFCVYYLQGRASPQEITADFVYVRLHGPDGPYKGKYTKEALQKWADAISSWVAKGKRVYCYFNNDEHGYAVENARELKELLGRYNR